MINKNLQICRFLLIKDGKLDDYPGIFISTYVSKTNEPHEFTKPKKRKTKIPTRFHNNKKLKHNP